MNRWVLSPFGASPNPGLAPPNPLVMNGSVSFDTFSPSYSVGKVRFSFTTTIIVQPLNNLSLTGQLGVKTT
jgi:hypothetical protein